ncbi:hypothetical protein [Deinococcus ruber]|uniref:Resolvase/invertase-type recombinase catalytic domain-containing protein n=1 Tax=Deinococcus ruber TaxID=1848197 RepID=A0A918FA61_9DEIO|nr:hypothetical protein [Deinococcus ruber]GGR23675.1 hypothetical protein GCM10008957_39440 [Deinococcus ruber]
MLQLFGEFEWEMIRERTRVGLKTARVQGQGGGRQSIFSSQRLAELVRSVQEARCNTAAPARWSQIHLTTASRLMVPQTYR